MNGVVYEADPDDPRTVNLWADDLEEPPDPPLTHTVCVSCATRLHGTASERSHEVLTDSEAEATLFRMSHHGHDVREAVVDA